jgi:hypothetical protein
MRSCIDCRHHPHPKDGTAPRTSFFEGLTSTSWRERILTLWLNGMSCLAALCPAGVELPTDLNPPSAGRASIEPTRTPYCCGHSSDRDQISLILPSAQRQAARDGTKQAGTPE